MKQRFSPAPQGFFRPRSLWFSVGLAAVLWVGWGWAVSRLSDPASQPGTFHPNDRRRHRLGHLSYAQTQRVIQRWERLRQQANTPVRKALVSVKLADIYMQRQMPTKALQEAQRAHTLVPQQIDVTVRLIMLLHLQKKHTQAQTLLQQALRQHPQHPGLREATQRIQAR